MNPINIVTPEPAKDPKTGFLVSLDNADVNLKSKESQFFDQVKKELQGNVLTSPGNASASFRFWEGSSLSLNESFAGNGFRYLPIDAPDFLVFSDNPSTFKLNNVKGITLSIKFLLKQLALGFFQFYSNTNYSVNFYLSTLNVNVNNQIQPNNFSIYRDELICVKVTATHQRDGTNGSLAYSLDRRAVKLNLSDYIISRPLITVAGGFSSQQIPNFNVDPEKITLQQYDNLLANDIGIYAFFGYDDQSYAALTDRDRVHFDLLYIPGFQKRSGNIYGGGGAGDLAGTSGTATTLSWATAGWTVNEWATGRYQVRIIAGTGAGQTRFITSNTATTLTVPTWTTTPNGTSWFVIENIDTFVQAPLQFVVDGTLIYFGTGASYEPINP
jgi:hypothetical protein